MNKIFAVLMMAGLTFGLALQPVSAKDDAFHVESRSYRVYLGIVPVSLLNKNPDLVDQDRQLHGGIAQLPATMQHVMVAVFRKDNNARVLDATVIAKVSRSKIFSRDGNEKPLEKMITSGAVAYANFFDMPERGDYRIDVNIFESHKTGSEKVRFTYVKD